MIESAASRCAGSCVEIIVDALAVPVLQRAAADRRHPRDTPCAIRTRRCARGTMMMQPAISLTEAQTAATFFHEGIEKWRQLNCTTDFGEYVSNPTTHSCNPDTFLKTVGSKGKSLKLLIFHQVRFRSCCCCCCSCCCYSDTNSSIKIPRNLFIVLIAAFSISERDC